MTNFYSRAVRRRNSPNSCDGRMLSNHGCGGKWLRAAVYAGLVSIGFAAPASADRIKHPIAVFNGLDKITGRIISFEVGSNETVQFGTLQITERACYTRPATEAPQTTSFLEIDEVDASNAYKKLFSGWMFAASPGLHGLEHPVYDVWLVDCKGGGEVIATPDTAVAEPPPEPQKPDAPAPKPTKPTKPKPRAVIVDDNPNDVQSGRNGGPIEVGPPPGFNSPSAGRQPVQRSNPTFPSN